MSKKLRQIVHMASLMDDYDKEHSDSNKNAQTSNTQVVDAKVTNFSDTLSAELCAAETLSSWRNIDRTLTQSARPPTEESSEAIINANAINTKKIKLEPIPTETILVETDTTFVAPPNSKSNADSFISSISSRVKSNFEQQQQNPNLQDKPETQQLISHPVSPKPENFNKTSANGKFVETDQSPLLKREAATFHPLKEITAASTLKSSHNSAFTFPLELSNSKNSNSNSLASASEENVSKKPIREARVDPFQQITIQTSHPHASLIFQNARFSRALRDPNTGDVDDTFKYRYIVYHCAFYGNPRKRGNGKRPNQNYMPCGCEAMLRLNFNHNDHCLKITTLRDVHKGHNLSAENYHRVSTKMRRISPSGSMQSSGEPSPASIRSESSLAIKSQANSPNTSNHNHYEQMDYAESSCNTSTASIGGNITLNNSYSAQESINLSLQKASSSNTRRPYRPRKISKYSVEKLHSEPKDSIQRRENQVTNNESSQYEQQGITADYNGSVPFTNQGENIEVTTRTSPEDCIERSLIAAASAMSVKASPITDPPSVSSKSSQSYSSDTRLLQDAYPSSSGSSLLSGSECGSSQKQRENNNKQNVPPHEHQHVYHQVHVDMPPGSVYGSASSSGSLSTNLSTNLLSPHTPVTDEMHIKYEKDPVTSQLLSSLFEDLKKPDNKIYITKAFSDQTEKPFTNNILNSIPTVPQNIHHFLNQNAMTNVTSTPSALLNTLSSQILALSNANGTNNNQTSVSYNMNNVPQQKFNISNEESKGNQINVFDNSTMPRLDSKTYQQQFLSSIFSGIVNQTPQQSLPQSADILRANLPLPHVDPSLNLHDALKHLIHPKASELNDTLLRLNGVTNSPAANVYSNEVKSTSNSNNDFLSKIQEILRDSLLANSDVTSALPNLQGPLSFQPNQLPPLVNNADLLLTLQNALLIHQQQQRNTNASENIRNQLLSLSEEDVQQNHNLQSFIERGSSLTFPGTNSQQQELFNSNFNSDVTKTEIRSNGECIIKKLWEYLHATNEPEKFVLELKRLYDTTIVARRSLFPKF